MHIPDEQLDLFAQRLSAIGVGRRDFLKVVGAMAAFGGLGFATEAHAATPNKPGARREAGQGAGVPLRRRRLVPERSLEPRLQQGPVLLGRARALRRAHGLQRRLRRGAVDGDQGGGQQGRLGLDVHDPEGQPMVGQLAGVARGTSSGRGSGSSIPPAPRPTPPSSTTSRTARPSTRRRSRTRSEVGVRAKDDWTLEVTLEGPRGYFPVLAAYLAALPAHKRAVEKYGDKWTEAGQPRHQWAVHARGVGPQQADRAQEEPALLRRRRTCI